MCVGHCELCVQVNGDAESIVTDGRGRMAKWPYLLDERNDRVGNCVGFEVIHRSHLFDGTMARVTTGRCRESLVDASSRTGASPGCRSLLAFSLSRICSQLNCRFSSFIRLYAFCSSFACAISRTRPGRTVSTTCGKDR